MMENVKALFFCPFFLDLFLPCMYNTARSAPAGVLLGRNLVIYLPQLPHRAAQVTIQTERGAACLVK